MYTVYKTTNLINSRYYIGVHKTDKPNDSYLGSGRLIKQAIKKYGRKNFEKTVLFVFEHQTEAYLKEAELVNREFVDDPITYNVCIGGSPSEDWDCERIRRHRDKMLSASHPMRGKQHTKESNKRRSESLKASSHLRDPIQWIRSGQTRKERGYASHWKGKTQTDESNTKRSESHVLLPKVKCPHCGKLCQQANATRWHFDNCRLVKPRPVKDKWLTCPHCNKTCWDSSFYMKNYHFDNCKEGQP